MIRSWQKSVRLVALVRCFVDDSTSKKIPLSPSSSLSHINVNRGNFFFLGKKHKESCVEKNTMFTMQQSLGFICCAIQLMFLGKNAPFPIQSLCSLTVGGSFRRFGRFTITAESGTFVGPASILAWNRGTVVPQM